MTAVLITLLRQGTAQLTGTPPNRSPRLDTPQETEKPPRRVSGAYSLVPCLGTSVAGPLSHEAKSQLQILDARSEHASNLLRWSFLKRAPSGSAPEPRGNSLEIEDRWSDVDLAAHTVNWRAETDKSGKAHQTALTDAAVNAVRVAWLRCGRSDDGGLFPSRLQGPALRTAACQDWWGKAATEAKLNLPAGCRFHEFRRKLASELVTEQLAVVKALGGWSQPHVVVSRY